MKYRFYIAVAAVAFSLLGLNANAQNSFAVKSNLFYDATTTLNGAVEFGLAPRWSLDV